MTDCLSINNKKSPRSLCWIFAHVLFYSLSAIVARVVSADIRIERQLLARSFVTVLVVLIMTRGRAVFSINSEHWKLLLLRGFLGFLGIYGTFYSFTVIPVPIAMMIAGLTPLLVMILGAIVLKERLSLELFAYGALAALSIFFVTWTNDKAPLDAKTIPAWGVVVALGSSFVTALAFLAVRSLVAVVGAQAVVFWFALVCCAGFLLVSERPADIAQAPAASKLLLSIFCLLGVASDIAKTKAYQYAEAWFVSLLSISSVAVSGLLGWLILSETLKTSQWPWIVIMMATLGLATFRSRST